MAYIPVADVCEVQLLQTLHGQRIENTLYFRLVGGFGATELANLWNILLGWWTTYLSAPLSVDLTLTGGILTDLSTSTGISLTYASPIPHPTGDSGNPALPGSVALCISFRTAGRGRSSRGRNYIAGLTEPSVTGNTVDAATVNSLQTSYNLLPGLPYDDPWEWVVVSRFTAGAPRAAGLAQVITAAVVVDPYVDSQRRRLTGRGL